MFYAEFWEYDGKQDRHGRQKGKWEKAKTLEQSAQISFKSCFHHLLAVFPGRVT